MIRSASFSLLVNGSPVSVMKYMDYHYAHFAFSGNVEVIVTSSETIANYRISPLSLGLQGKVESGKKLSFSLSEVSGDNATPRYLILQINAMEKLVLLCDPPEKNPPAAGGEGIFNVVTDFSADSTGSTYTQPSLQNAINAASAYGTPTRRGIVYVPRGVYKVRADLLLKDNVELYLAPGSVLKADPVVSNYSVRGGTIGPVLSVDNARNVTIRGRGEVDASGTALMNLFSRTPPVFVSQSDANPRRRVIRTNNGGTSENVVIDGIVCKDASGWSVELKRTLGVRAQNVKVLNHKNINWKIENDGINVCSSSDALVNQCFVMTIDDAGCAKATDAIQGEMRNVQFSNNVLWTWSAGAKAGMQNDHAMNGVIFRNLDIVHCRRAIAVDTKTSQDSGRTIPIEGVLFENIRVEEMEGHWNIANYDVAEFLLEDAPANNITIRNLSCPKNRPIRCGPNYPANNVTFENLVLNGGLITSVSGISLAGKQPINNLQFISRHPAAILTGPETHREKPFEIIADFNEPVAGLALGDFVVSNGTASLLEGGPSLYTVKVIPSSTDWVSISLPAGSARSMAFLDSLSSNELRIPRAAREIPLPEVSSGTLYLHLAADDLKLANEAVVTNWEDKVHGVGFTGTASYLNDYARGHAAVRFNGTSNMLGNTNLPGNVDVGQTSLFVVANFTGPTNDPTSDFIICGQYPDSTSNNRLRIFKRSGDGRVDARVGSGSTIPGVVADNSPHLFSLVSGSTAGSVKFIIDGRLVNEGSSGETDSLKGLFLGAYGKTPDQFMDGAIAEIILYQGALSPLDCARIQDFLCRKYFGRALDSDFDGLPDVWEISQFGNLDQTAGGSGDADGDSVSDVTEWITGTNPKDSDSFFSSVLRTQDSEQFTLSFPATPEREYILESSPDMVDWTALGSMHFLSADPLQTLLLNPTSENHRFFRIRISIE